MRDNLQCLRNGAVKRCAICNGNLVSSGTAPGERPLFRKCIDRFNARQDGDRRWMHWRDLCYHLDRDRSLAEGSGPGEP
jgi:hypothetical protein